MNDQAKTQITGVHTVAVPVTDSERALDFYTGTLGFTKRLDAPFGDGGRWIEVAPPGAETTIALVASGAAGPGADTGIRLTATGVDELHATLLARGVQADPDITRLPGVPPMFGFRDQDANRLVIVGQA